MALNFFGGETVRSVVSRSVVDAISKVLVNVSNTVSSELSVTNTIDVNCQVTINNYPEDSEPCKRCFSSILQRQKEYHNAVRQSWKSERAGIARTFREEMSEMKIEIEACRFLCKSCVGENLRQSAKTTYDFQAVSSNQITNELESKLGIFLEQDNTLKTGVLSSLAGILGASSSAQVVNYLSTSINNLIQVDAIINRLSEFKASNLIEIKSGNSIVTTGISQTMVKHAVDEVLVQNNIMNSLFTEAEWEWANKSYSDSRVLGKLGEIAADTVDDASQIITSFIYKISFYITIAAGIVFGAVLLYTGYRYYFTSVSSSTSSASLKGPG